MSLGESPARGLAKALSRHGFVTAGGSGDPQWHSFHIPLVSYSISYYNQSVSWFFAEVAPISSFAHCFFPLQDWCCFRPYDAQLERGRQIHPQARWSFERRATFRSCHSEWFDGGSTASSRHAATKPNSTECTATTASTTSCSTGSRSTGSCSRAESTSLEATFAAAHGLLGSQDVLNHSAWMEKNHS